jgi:hypothetical protein
MRPTLIALVALSATALGAPALAQDQATALAPATGGQPSESDIRTHVPTVDLRSLSPTDIARRNALYGPGWQYRMAPISPGLNSNVPINPGVGVSPADLSNLDQRIKADEVVMTRMRDAELAREDAQIAAIRPALPWVWEGRQTPGFLQHVNLPDFSSPFRWVRNRF